MRRKAARTCAHAGPYRAVQGAREEGPGPCAVLCVGCGALQWPGADAWSGGLEPDVSFSDGFRLDLLSETSTDRDQAHRIASAGEHATAIARRDGGWFVHRGLVPPWWETKRHEETGDLLYRPASYFDEQAAVLAVWDEALAPRPQLLVPLAARAAAPSTQPGAAADPVPCRRCGHIVRLAMNTSAECSACGQPVVRGVA